MANKSQVFKCKSKRIISVGEEEISSEIFMSIKFCLLDTITNLNGINYSKAFLEEIADNPQKYLSLPLMAEFAKLSKGKTNNLTHAYDKDKGTFSSQMIGSFISFETQPNADDETITELVGEARVPKRFTDIIEVLQELFDTGNLTLSYEMSIGEYKQVGQIKYVDVSEFNYLFAMACVTSPAVLSAHSLTLVAQIMEGENIIEGGEKENMQRNKETFTAEMMFENSKINLAELDICQVKTKLFNQLRENMDDNYWMYDSQDIGVDYVILKNYSTADLVKVEFKVENNDVTIIDTYDVDKTYVKKVIPNEGGEDPMTIAELNAQIVTMTAEAVVLNATIETNKTELAEVNEKLVAKDVEIASINTNLTTVSETLLAKTAEVEAFAPIKAAHETMLAEKATEKLVADKVALKEKFSKVLSAEVIIEMAEAFENLDESKINAKIVELAMATANATKVPNAKKEVTLASRIVDNVKMSGAEPGSLKEKYSI